VTSEHHQSPAAGCLRIYRAVISDKEEYIEFNGSPDEIAQRWEKEKSRRKGSDPDTAALIGADEVLLKEEIIKKTGAAAGDSIWCEMHTTGEMFVEVFPSGKPIEIRRIKTT